MNYVRLSLHRCARPPIQPSTQNVKAEMKTEVLAQNIFHYESVQLCVKGEEPKKAGRNRFCRSVCQTNLKQLKQQRNVFFSFKALSENIYLEKKLKVNSNPDISCTNCKHVIARNCNWGSHLNPIRQVKGYRVFLLTNEQKNSDSAYIVFTSWWIKDVLYPQNFPGKGHKLES